MGRVGKLQAWFDRAKKHWAITLWLGVVGLAAGYVALSGFLTTIKQQLTSEPAPKVIQLEAVPEESLAYNVGRTRWMVTVENRSDEPLGITRAHYRVELLGNTYFNANAIELTRNVYRLPLDCKSGRDSRPFVPPFQVPPQSFATFVIDGGKNDLDCLFRLSFDTTKGTTGEMLAEPF